MINEKRYSELIRARRSVRTFDGKGISDDIMEQLRVFAASCPNPYDIPMEFRFLNAKEHGLKSPVIAGTDEYVAVKLKRVPGFEEALGYSLEKFVLDAWSVGIGTTWIGGTMDRPAFERAMELADDEIMPCVSPIGYAARRMSLKEIAMRKGVGADRRKPFEELFFDGSFDQPLTEAKAGQLTEATDGQPTGTKAGQPIEVKAGQLLLPLQMVRLAPSAVNKQPWRVVIAGEYAHFYKKSGKGFSSSAVGDMQKIDMGIALCHFALGAEEAGLGVDGAGPGTDGAGPGTDGAGPAVELEICDPGIPVPEKTEYIASFRFGGK